MRTWATETGNCQFPSDRFLEYTEPHLVAARFRTPGAEQALLELPTLFAYESEIGKPARLGKITNITKTGRQIALTYVLNADPVIAVGPEGIEDLRHAPAAQPGAA